MSHLDEQRQEPSAAYEPLPCDEHRRCHHKRETGRDGRVRLPGVSRRAVQKDERVRNCLKEEAKEERHDASLSVDSVLGLGDSDSDVESPIGGCEPQDLGGSREEPAAKQNSACEVKAN